MQDFARIRLFSKQACILCFIFGQVLSSLQCLLSELVGYPLNISTLKTHLE